jgi:hypothetical protein
MVSEGIDEERKPWMFSLLHARESDVMDMQQLFQQSDVLGE